MNLDKLKSGLLFGDAGGIFLGRNIETDYLRNRFYTDIASLDGLIKVSSKHFDDSVNSVLISPNLHFRIVTGNDDHIAFIHIDPYSLTGLKLKRHKRIIELPGNWFDGNREDLSRCFSSWVFRSAPFQQRLQKNVRYQAVENEALAVRYNSLSFSVDTFNPK